jgi:hypothetical protein
MEYETNEMKRETGTNKSLSMVAASFFHACRSLEKYVRPAEKPKTPYAWLESKSENLEVEMIIDMLSRKKLFHAKVPLSGSQDDT